MELVICGLGRIGRALTRIISQSDSNVRITNFIDVEDNIDNLIYLLNNDSNYGWLTDRIKSEKNKIHGNNINAQYINTKSYLSLDWEELRFDMIIDCSGIERDWKSIQRKCKQHKKYVFVSHHPTNFPGTVFIEEYIDKKANEYLFAGSICDAVGIAPIIKIISEKIKIKSISAISLHPWLSYQNLLDGTVKSISNPGHSWNDYALGRSSIGSLIPKETSITSVLKELFPNIENISAMSYRVPTSNTTSAIVNIQVENAEKELEKRIKEIIKDNVKKDILCLSNEPLVSIDFKGRVESSIMDERYLKQISNDIIRAVLWYDNEWGYASSIFRRTKYIINK